MVETPSHQLVDLDFIEGLCTTRSIRRYRDQPISEDQLATMFHVATRAPSGSNRQPFRFVALRKEDPAAAPTRRLVAEGAKEVWLHKRGLDEFPERDPSTPTGRMLAAMDAYVAGLEHVPLIVLPCMIRYRAPTVTEGASIYPAVQNLLLGARAVGLGGALTMFHGPREQEIASLIGLPDEAFIAATVTIGVPAGSHGPVRRRPLRDLVYDARWDTSPSWAVDPPGTRFTGSPKGAPSLDRPKLSGI